jgi:transcriptional regulator with XRE-family HTH domain
METLQNSRSKWFRDRRQEAGYKTDNALAKRLRAPQPVVQKWASGTSVPSPKYILKLARALHVEVSEADRALGRKRVGDPCPGGCGGRFAKPPSDGKGITKHGSRAGEQYLRIELPCSGCGDKRFYGPYHGDHRILCPKCAQRKKSERVPRVEYNCPGYGDHDAKNLHAPKCPEKYQLTPGEIRQNRKLQEQRDARPERPEGVHWQRPFFDEVTKTLRCNFCASASRKNAEIEGQLKPLTDEPIRSRGQRKELANQFAHELFPGLKPTRRGQKRRSAPGPISVEGRRSINRGQLFAAWSGETLPRSYRFGRCLLRRCNGITISGRRLLKFHGQCWRAWLRTPEGRRYLSLHKRKKEARLPSRKRGQPVTEENLRTYYAWTIQHYLGEKRSYRMIGEKSGVDFTTVRDKIDFVVNNLDPKLQEPGLRNQVSLILDAAKKRNSSNHLNSTHTAVSNSAHTPV